MIFALSFLIISYLQVLSSKFIKSNHCCFSIYSFHVFLYLINIYNNPQKNGSMKKKIMLAIIAIAASLKVSAQIQFSEFKFFVANIYDFSQLQLEVKFKVTSERNLKYVNVHFCPVNQVGDAICDDIVGGVNANTKFSKYQLIQATGPFETKKSYKRHFGIYHISGKKPTPFPYMVTIDYMGGGSDTIRITRDNIKTYFPKTKWIDVDYKSGFQPDN